MSFLLPKMFCKSNYWPFSTVKTLYPYALLEVYATSAFAFGAGVTAFLSAGEGAAAATSAFGIEAVAGKPSTENCGKYLSCHSYHRLRLTPRSFSTCAVPFGWSKLLPRHDQPVRQKIPFLIHAICIASCQVHVVL